jgi:hypothetical protein
MGKSQARSPEMQSEKSARFIRAGFNIFDGMPARKNNAKSYHRELIVENDLELLLLECN